ncbi:MAG: CpXC domain-containing protein [Anaerolineae bacterium]|nr:MAG: CpXC domain-containing protein [Anaerolineae bacterium]
MVAPGTAVRCPNCGSPIQAHVHQLVDVGQDPSAKSRLLSGSLNFVRCPVCQYEGQLSAPLVYHDPGKELLLTYIPVELGIPKDEQEKLIGRLVNQAIEALPTESRKGYLLQPQAVLTIQGLIERILEGDGVTREELDAQRAKIRLFEDLLRAPQESLAGFVAEHDGELDERFFQLAALSLQTAADESARASATQKLERTLELSSYGKRLAEREAELRSAAESLREAGDDLTREKLLELILEAANDDRVQAIVSLARPGLDYSFFQQLTERIDQSEGEEAKRLEALRRRLLEQTEEIDQAQEARLAQASNLVSSLVQAEDLDQAVKAALPAIDELFLAVLQANIRGAEESGDQELLVRLKDIEQKLNTAIIDSLPPNLRLAQQLLGTEDEQEAQRILDQSVELIDDQLLGALLTTSQRLEEADDKEGAERLRRLHRHALRLSMRANISS